MSGVQVGLLGPLRVLRDGTDVTPSGSRLRALLCRLAVDAGRPVSSGELAEAVWGDAVPAEPTNALQSLISRLRRALGAPGLVVQEPRGYRLVVDAADVDASCLSVEVDRGDVARAAGDLATATRAYAAALALWRGEPLLDAGDAAYAAPRVERWAALRLAAARGRAECALGSGAGATVVDELVTLVAEHPLDERLRLLLMRTLAAAGRGAEALAAYEDARRVLADALGTDPGPELAALHLRLLRGEVEPDRVVRSPARRHNLPRRRTSFVGREPDLGRVLGALRTSRLVTVVGPGGAGKTRLAVEAASRWLDEGGDAAWLVELAPVVEPAGVPEAALAALGLRDARLTAAERVPSDPIERLLAALQGRRTLLVVDNCEHLLDATAALVDGLLGEDADLVVLATSREALAVDGEVLAPLAPLPLPPADVDAEAAAGHVAVRLWLDRAAAVAPGFVLDATTVGPVVEVVRRLDGLPLALELAAARLGVLPVDEIARRLSDRFHLLTGGNRAGLPRHRTLRAVVGWSWDLLSPAERLLAERLSVFPAGAETEAAVRVCADDRLPAAEVDALLLALVEKSLLHVSTEDGPLRFTMLETLREYGAEQLAGRGELDAARSAHAAYFAALVERLEPVLRSSEQLGALDRLRRERENVLAALRHLVDTDDGPTALRTCLALTWYWTLVDSPDESMTWLRSVVATHAGTADEDVAHALAYAEAALRVSALFGSESFALGGWTEERDRLVEVTESLVDVPAPFPGLGVLRVMVASFAGRPDLVDRFVAEAEAGPDPWLRAAVLSTVASIAENAGDVDGMRRAAASAYAGFRTLGDRWGLSATLLVLAQLAVLDGDLDAALLAYEEAAGHVEALGSTEDDLYLRIRLADLLSRQGQVDRARALVADFAEDADGARAIERDLVAQAILVNLELDTGRTAVALEGAARLRQRVLEGPTTGVMSGHLTAICLGATALVEVAAGDAGRARADLVVAYAAGRRTRDMPILATVGVAVATLALRDEDPVEAATLLGATARVRGAEDPTDPVVARLTGRLQEELGAGFAVAYAAGWSSDQPAAADLLDPARSAPADRPAVQARRA